MINKTISIAFTYVSRVYYQLFTQWHIGMMQLPPTETAQTLSRRTHTYAYRFIQVKYKL